MPTLSSTNLNLYRQKTFRLSDSLRLRQKEQAIDYVKERGFIFFWPTKGITFPSLWTAVAGDRPVPDEHDDPGHITWGWKDELIDKRVWYYARVLKHRNTFISLDDLPYFYALSPNYGDPDTDYLIQYEEGTFPQEAKLVYEALLKEGQLDTLSLRKAAHLAGSESTGRFNKALDILQQEFKILPVRIAQAGAWNYAFVYELTHRFFPDLIADAGPISEFDARRKLTLRYLRSLGAAVEKDITRMFGWRPIDVAHTLETLAADKKIVRDVQVDESAIRMAAIPELVQQD